MTGNRPSVSIVIPTLNAERTLPGCLESIERQEYGGSVEVVVADGGSTDDTLSVAEAHGCVVVDNFRKTGEAGKAAGVRAASGEIIALVDSDNILTGDDWLERMTAPFSDSRIAGSEPLEYEHRRADPALTRYCALMGMNDPLCYFLGNYDRMCTLSGRWTGLEVEVADRGDYLEVRLESGALPTMGANGFMVRRSLLESLEIGDYLFDIDVIHELVVRGHDRFAKVKTGIVHLYGQGLATFARKQLRRTRDFHYYRSLGMRSYPWSNVKKSGLVKFIVFCLLVFPLILQSIKGYLLRQDPAWALHVPACLITLAVYGWGFLEGFVRPREQERSRWGQ